MLQYTCGGDNMDERFGFIRDKIDIKILILFVLRRLPESVDFPTLAELVICDDGISYFDFAECVAELINTGHIYYSEDMYSITEKGRRNGEITESSLPYSVRIKAERNANIQSQHQKRNALISTSHEYRNRSGYIVSLSLSDGISDIISMELIAGSEIQAEFMENKFRKNAERIYDKIMNIMTNDDE